MVFFALGVGDAQYQHVLGQPALVAPHGGGNAQGKTLFAQQRVAAVARAVAPNFACFGVVHDVFGGGVARPRHVGLAGLQRRAHGVHARHKVAVGAKYLVHRRAHAGHELHVDRDVGAVRQLNPNVCNGAAQRPHGKRHHVHGAAFHATVKQGLQGRAHGGRVLPVVGGAGVFLLLAANKGAVFYAGHVRGVRPRQI